MYDISDIVCVYCGDRSRMLCLLGIFSRNGGACLTCDGSMNGGDVVGDSNEKMPDGYQKLINDISPKPTVVKNVVWAFMVGGFICLLGQLLQNYFSDSFGLEKKEAAQAVVIAVIFMGAFLTGLGVYDEIGKRAGAGSIVPISGFANSIVAPAMEFRREGLVFGVGAKMFVIAGPVIVYGVTTAVVIGIVYWLIGGQGG